MEKVRIQGLATPESGGAMGGSVAHPTLFKVKSKTGMEGRLGQSRRENGLHPYYCIQVEG
jgi:hypothetical protein